MINSDGGIYTFTCGIWFVNIFPYDGLLCEQTVMYCCQHEQKTKPTKSICRLIRDCSPMITKHVKFGAAEIVSSVFEFHLGGFRDLQKSNAIDDNIFSCTLNDVKTDIEMTNLYSN